MKYAIILAAALLAACTNMPSSFDGMSAGQIKEIVKDKSSDASCIEFTGTGGQFRALHMGTDSGVVKNGTATLECGSAKATFSNGGKIIEGPPPK